METQRTDAEIGKKGGGSKGIVIVALVVVVAVLIGVIVYLVIPKETKEEKRNIVVTPDNIEEVIEEIKDSEFVEPGYYTVTMNNTWHFASATDTTKDGYIENSPKNTNDVYFDLFLEGDEENPIYKSPVIPIGSSLTDLALDTELENGTYPCVCIYHLVDEDQNTVSTLRVGVTVIIGEE